MCGIAGWLGGPPDTQNVHTNILQALHHRGPDSCGARVWKEAGLLHTRLSIIDLSSAGEQPISNADGTVWAVFNGEIYNHHELRHQLESKGHVFKGRSDSEVLPHMYEEEGPDFVSKLRGMFAFAIFDISKKKILLGRDRFGIKPLFYAPSSGRLAFASEIRALLVMPDIDDRPDRQAIYDFAALFYIPAPETFYVGIRALLPGELLEGTLDSQGVTWKTRVYHRWRIAPDASLSLAEAAARAEDLLEAAVQSQMESDVPLGALLSGGIDSSLVSAAAQGLRSTSIRTFNVRFPDVEYDETWAAVAVANSIGSTHTTLDIESMQGTWEHVTSLLRHVGQPYADTSLFAVNAISRLMRQHVAVALSGDGGDEGFGGYNMYWQIARIARLQSCPAFALRLMPSMLSPLAWIGLIPDRFLKRVEELSVLDDISMMQNLFSWIRQEEHDNLCLDKGKMLPIRRLFEPALDMHLDPTVSRVERLSAAATEANVRLVLPNDFLFKVDMASMKESLEIRVPMLDEDLFAFGLTLPHRLKVRRHTCKRVLRAVAQRRLPQHVVDKPKWGFSIPIDRWVDSEFKASLRTALLGPASRLPEYFKSEAYRPWIEAFCTGGSHLSVSRQGLYQRVIMLLSLHLALANR